MNKFDNLVNSFISEDQNLDQWHAQKMKEEGQPSGKHEFDTLSHPLKDEILGLLPLDVKFKSWIKEGEHQDGETFWDNFERVQDAMEDFLRTIIPEDSQN